MNQTKPTNQATKQTKPNKKLQIKPKQNKKVENLLTNSLFNLTYTASGLDSVASQWMGLS